MSKCLPHILAKSNLGKQLGLTKDTAFNTIAEIRELIDSKGFKKFVEQPIQKEIREGYTRLYRIGNKENDSAIWWTDKIEDLEFYKKSGNSENPTIYYVDVTKEELEKAKVKSGKNIGENEYQFIEERGNKLSKERIKTQEQPIQKEIKYSTSQEYNNDLQKGLQWLKSVMPDVEPLIVQGLIDNIARGSYNITNDLITLSKDFADKKVVKEEAFHRIFNLLPKSEQEKLLNEGSKKYNIERGESKATIKYSLADQNKINYVLKSVEILQSSKANEIFRKGDKNNWSIDKMLQELQVPKEQQELIKSFNTRNREEILTSLLANYSYTIEINTTKESMSDSKLLELSVKKEFQKDNFKYFSDNDGYWRFDNTIDSKDRKLEKIDLSDYTKAYRESIEAPPTQYYANLTVLGGTNYTENEIATPAITPSIKGHAQFATENGIGWFRSDEKESKIVGWKEEDDFLNSETAQYNPITKDDKIIFGHPGIGKTYLKEIGKTNIIDFDTDYKSRVNEEFNLPKGFKARNDFQKNHKEEYQKAVRKLWEEAKQEAKKTGKQLFASDMILLREFANDFDKVITISKDTFINRAKQRNDYTEGETEKWKTSLDTEISKIDKSKVINTDKYLSDLLEGNPKTRRILEVQSDLFQKGRDKEDLTNNKDLREKNKRLEEDLYGSGFDELLKERNQAIVNSKNSSENQFLQLLNKNNNWVTFFVKSIIQDSAKKGYEKVLFPTGNTASKVEGHTTLEEFKKQKEDRIKELEIEKNKIDTQKVIKNHPFIPQLHQELEREENGFRLYSNNTPEQLYTFDKLKEPYNREINQLKQELERVEKEGFGALKPIYNFYEETVGNILKKQGYNPELITDEYGNTWNEIILSPKDIENIRLNTPNGKIEYKGDLAIEEKMAEEAYNSKDERQPTTLIGKFIQSIRNLLRNIFKEKDNISRLVRNLNQGRLTTQEQPIVGESKQEIKDNNEEDWTSQINNCGI